MDWIAANVPARDVMLASPEYSALIAALSGHRVLFPPAGDTGTLPQPFKRALLFQSAKRGMPIARLADELSVTHLFLGPGESLNAAVLGGSIEPVRSLELAYQDSEDFRVFRFLKK